VFVKLENQILEITLVFRHRFFLRFINFQLSLATTHTRQGLQTNAI